MSKPYIVDLSEVERGRLQALVAKGKVYARQLARARILLAADEGIKDTAIAQTLQVHVNTVARIRKHFVEGGLDRALNERPRRRAKRKLGMKQEAHLIALASSQAPEGCNRWSLRLLADRLVKLGIVENVSHETVRRTLKRARISCQAAVAPTAARGLGRSASRESPPISPEPHPAGCLRTILDANPRETSHAAGGSSNRSDPGR